MKKNVLRKLSFLIYFAMALVAITLQSTIFKYFPLNFFLPDFVLIMTVYLGFKRETVEAGALVVLSSLAMEAHSGSGEYFLLTGYVYSFVITKLLSKVIVVPNRATVVLIVVGLSIFTKIINFTLLSTVNRASNGLLSFAIHLIPNLMTQALFSVMLIELFTTIDLKTYKDSHAEDEYDINREF